MAKRVYIETTIPSYLASWRSRDLLQAARQVITHTWWDERRQDYDLYISELVLDEAAAGDVDAARRRLSIVEGLPILAATESADDVAEALLDSRLLPSEAARDAAHIALASVHGMDFLLTLNCKHIADPRIMNDLRRIVEEFGYDLPVICTPEGLLGD